MSEARENPSAYRWLVFALLAAAYFMVYFHRTSPAVVALDMMADLKAGSALMGLLASAYFYPYALMQLPAGLLSDSWGPRRSVSVFFILAALASIYFGLVNSVGTAILARVLVGLGVSMLFVPTMKILTRWFRQAEFAGMMGLLMALGGLGVLFSAQPLAYLSSIVGWRGSFIWIGAATLVLGGLIWAFVRDKPEDKGLPPVTENDQPSRTGQLAVPVLIILAAYLIFSDRLAGLPLGVIILVVAIWLWLVNRPDRGPATAPARVRRTQDRIPEGHTPTLGEGVRMVLGNGSFWVLAIWFFVSPAIFFAFAGLWGGPFLMQAYDLSRTEAGAILSMTAIGMIVGSPVVSFLSDMVFKSRKVPIIICTVLTLVVMTIFTFFPGSLFLGIVHVLCFILGISSSAIVVVGFTSSKELFPLPIAGTATGLVNLFPFIGGAVLQVAVGWVLEKYGGPGPVYSAEDYGTAFTVLFGAAIIGLICAVFMRDTLEKVADNQSAK